MISSASPDFQLSLGICSWVLWALAVVTAVCRFLSRRLQRGPGVWRDLHADDYLMVVAVLSLTGVVISSNQVATNGSNYVPDGETDTWSPAQVAEAVWGSKMLVALEEFMVCTLWLVKACLLILYARMTSGLRESLAVKLTGGYCALGFVLIQVLYLGVWCRPITNYWAVPIPPGNEQCKTYHNHLITITVLHVSSDLMMLAIPLPMIARSRLPLRRKLILIGVFGLGVLVVLLAVLNRYYNFVMPHDLVFLAWYNGEAATAVMIANVPFCWGLLRRIFALDPWGHSSGAGPSNKRGTGAGAGDGGNVMIPPPTIGSGGKRGRVRGIFDTASTGRDDSPSESMERITKESPKIELLELGKAL